MFVTTGCKYGALSSLHCLGLSVHVYDRFVVVQYIHITYWIVD